MVRSLIGISVLALLVLATCTKPVDQPTLPALSANLTFRALWWSSDEMVGLDPNRPPPKTHEIELEKWEYSDPIGVPHPDTIDVDLLLSSQRADLQDLRIVLRGFWKTGPLKKETAASWDPDAFLDRSFSVSLKGHETQHLRVPVNLQEKMDELYPKERWPWQLRIEVTILEGRSGSEISRMTKDLPITPGD